MTASISTQAPAPPPPATPASLGKSLALAARDIKLAHSIFALPFAVLAAFLATPATRPAAPAGAWRAFGLQLALVVACMVFARTWAMLVNRIADRRFDVANPRTARRALPSGTLSLDRARLFAGASALAFVGGASLFYPLDRNPWPAALSIPVLAFIALYSYTKRFTALCHVFLGAALAASPLAAALAVHPHALRTTPALWWIAAFVLLWVAGFDVLYALQDLEFDRRTRLRSIPALLGQRRAIWISRLLHLAAIAALVASWRTDQRLGSVYVLGLIGVVLLLMVEHSIVAWKGRDGFVPVFTTINGAVSCVLCTSGLVGVLS